jgi:hypothetical protein
MPAGSRARRETTDEWAQLRPLVTSREQEPYELLRPIVLFGQPAAARARETGVPERTLRRLREVVISVMALGIHDMAVGDAVASSLQDLARKLLIVCRVEPTCRGHPLPCTSLLKPSWLS